MENKNFNKGVLGESQSEREERRRKRREAIDAEMNADLARISEESHARIKSLEDAQEKLTAERAVVDKQLEQSTEALEKLKRIQKRL